MPWRDLAHRAGTADDRFVQGAPFDAAELFRAIEASRARALLIGRQALIVLGIPVITSDFDFWIHRDDIGILNSAVEPLGFVPNRTPEEARANGRYVLEDGEHVDVLVARVVHTVDAQPVSFDDLWSRHSVFPTPQGPRVAIPNIDDLILTKRFAARARDREDIRLLELLKSEPNA